VSHLWCPTLQLELLMTLVFVLDDLVAVDESLTLLVRHRNDHVAQADVVVVVGVVGHAAAHADQEHVLDAVECT